MRKILLTFALLFLSITFLFSYEVVLADDEGALPLPAPGGTIPPPESPLPGRGGAQGDTLTPRPGGGGPQGTVAPSAGVGSTVRLQNPLSGISTIPQLLAAILNIVVILAIPVIIFFIMLAGFKYVTARGNATQIQEASKALLYAVIGAVLILGATAIAQIVKNLVDAFR